MIQEIDFGNTVICDWTCGEDFTESEAKGGLIFGSKAVCPNCADEMMKNVIAYGEQQYIREVCPEDKTFRDFVLGLRAGNNKVRVVSGKDFYRSFKKKEAQ